MSEFGDVTPQPEYDDIQNASAMHSSQQMVMDTIIELERAIRNGNGDSAAEMAKMLARMKVPVTAQAVTVSEADIRYENKKMYRFILLV